MRLSHADLKKIGIEVKDGKVTTPKDRAAAKGRKKTAEGEASKPTGRAATRLPRLDYGRRTLRFEIALSHDPQPKERPRTVTNRNTIISAFAQAKGSIERFKQLISGRISNTYTPANTAAYEEEIKLHAIRAMAEARMQPFDVPVSAYVHLVFKGEPGVWPTSPADGDYDNLMKAPLDAMNKIVYVDDRLVVDGYCRKSCGPVPKLIVRIRPARR
jgi:Holliday junction resolvase RusA-like endonuclease